jgi:mannose-6-phosphate isomerase
MVRRRRHVAAPVLAELKSWLAEKAYPIWWQNGADHRLGGFHEQLRQDGAPVLAAKRARVQPRQIYSFSKAHSLGWAGDGPAAVRHGIDFFLAHYRRADGLFRTLVTPEGGIADDSIAFYDQAFALLGLHAAYVTLGEPPFYRDLARQLLAQWRATRAHAEIGFAEQPSGLLPLGANPHMHLLESALAWSEVDEDGPWLALAEELVQLALTRLIGKGSGALREFFDRDWRPMPGYADRQIEPGHQFEWAWLLLRWSRLSAAPAAQAAALRLIALGESHGVDSRRGVAINGLRDDLGVADGNARLWPQTERLKAHCLAAELTGERGRWASAIAAARGLMRYLDTPLAGLWYDQLTPEDRFIDQPAPASSFYHIVCAIAELDRAVAATS